MPGVKAILTADDLPGAQAGATLGENVVSTAQGERPLTMEPVYEGEPILAVAAVDELTAAEAIEKIVIEFEPLPFNVDVVERSPAGQPERATAGQHVDASGGTAGRRAADARALRPLRPLAPPQVRQPQLRLPLRHLPPAAAAAAPARGEGARRPAQDAIRRTRPRMRRLARARRVRPPPRLARRRSRVSRRHAARRRPDAVAAPLRPPQPQITELKWTEADFAAAKDGQMPMGKATDEWTFGDVDAVMKTADLVLDETFVTQSTGHQPLETRTAMAYWQNGKLFIHCSTQSTVQTVAAVARGVGIPPAEAQDKIVLISEYTGGGFGSKIPGLLSTWRSRRCCRRRPTRRCSCASAARKSTTSAARARACTRA